MKLSRLKTFCLCLFSLFVYLFVIFKIGTRPFSDFQFYYEVALGILRGETISSFYKYFSPPGYPYILSLIIPIYNHSILIPKVLNALFLSGLIWVYLRHPFTHSSTALLIGYLVLVFNVNCLGMVNILGTEISYAFFFLTGLYTFGWGIRSLFEKDPQKTKRKYVFFATAGLLFGMSQFIRPMTFLFLFILSFCAVLGFLSSYGKRGKHIRLNFIPPFVVAWCSFFIGAVLLYWVSGYGMTYVPHQKGIWNLYVGFNIESKGRWTLEDSKVITRLGEKENWDGIMTNKEFLPVVTERLKSNWIRNFEILPEKLFLLLDPKDISFFVIDKSGVRNKEGVYKAAHYLSWLNGFVFGMSLWAWLLCLIKKNKSFEEFFAFCVLGASFVLLIVSAYFFEVQGRYSNHIWMTLFVLIPISLNILKQSLASRIIGGCGFK